MEIELNTDFHLPRLKTKGAFYAMRDAGMEYTFGVGLWKIPDNGNLEAIAEAMRKYYKGFVYVKVCTVCGQRVYGLEDLIENYRDHLMNHAKDEFPFPPEFYQELRDERRVTLHLCNDCNYRARGIHLMWASVMMQCRNPACRMITTRFSRGTYDEGEALYTHVRDMRETYGFRRLFRN